MTNTEAKVSHAIQELFNDSIPRRGVVALTLKLGESIELTNGVTIFFSRARSSSQVGLVVLASKDIRISRGYRAKRKR